MTTITIDNPNPVPIPIKDVKTEAAMAGVQMGKGEALQPEIKPDTTSKLKIRTEIENERIDEWWVKHLEKGERSNLNIGGDVIFDLKVTTFTYPVEKERAIETDFLASLKQNKDQQVTRGDIPIAGPVTVTIKSIDPAWGDITSDTTEIIAKIKVHNDEAFPISVTRLEATGTMNGVELITGETGTSRVLQPGETSTITATADLDNGKIPEWWTTHIKNGEKTRLKLDIDAVIEAKGTTQTTDLKEVRDTIETDLLG